MGYGRWIKLMLRNLLLLALGILPFMLMLQAVMSRLFGADASEDVLGVMPLLYVGFIGPLLAAGFVYLLCIFLVAQKTPRTRRLLAITLTPVMVLVWALLGFGGVLMIGTFAFPFAIALIAYGVLVKPLPSEEQEHSSSFN